MSFEDKPVSLWSSKEYEEFWNQYVKEITITKCKLCGKELSGLDISGHMERKHSEKYQEHDDNLEQQKEPERPETALDQVRPSK